jgi:hypothetical protein
MCPVLSPDQNKNLFKGVARLVGPSLLSAQDTYNLVIKCDVHHDC